MTAPALCDGGPWRRALKEFFAQVGTIARADIAIDDTGRSRGQGPSA
jgi:hypothetical protein